VSVGDDPFSAASRSAVLGLRPELAAAHGALLDTIWQQVDPVLLELCRLRMAKLLGATAAMGERSPEAVAAGLTEDLVERLPRWPHDPAFTDAQRAALAFAEQLVIDHHGTTDEQIGALTAALGPEGVIALTTALGVWDNQHRLDRALGVVEP
jgi:alkylhydroperoxidase family enzyme